MIVQYDMATGECIEEGRAAAASPQGAKVPVPALGLQPIETTACGQQTPCQGLPASLVDVPVDLFLAEQYHRR